MRVHRWESWSPGADKKRKADWKKSKRNLKYKKTDSIADLQSSMPKYKPRKQTK